jgi:hypothetical protein
VLKLAKTAMAAAALSASGSAFAAASLTDGSFEAQGAGVSSFCYFGQNNGGDGACATGAWTGAGAGIQNETNSAWPGTASDDGSVSGFVQGLGIFGQYFSATGGTYRLTWQDAGRAGGVAEGNQTYQVLLQADGSPATVLGTFSTTTGQAFTPRSIAGIALADGVNYALAFRGTNPNGGDNTAFLDSIALAPVPEPATWAMMIGGMGVVGGSLRKRGRALSRTA